ncbi:alpha/beta fold hydrolase [Mesonia sp. K7]|uniref:alpha/beta fold hydrolase n=1 Tax=Mesonia sp. K7 TaxID=2218606 RepID=UPI000DAA57CA|nr:alpha/beta fold hydrolase [Mesonia sp. K7]PZD77602.1 alpha/beta hydrolase [Mesonia sp. K7]
MKIFITAKYYLLFFLSLPSVFAQQQGNIATEDGNIYYEIYGEGKPLLIINGGPGFSSKGFASLAQELSKTNQVILYDQRATGNSTLKEVNSKTITLQNMVEDIEVLRCHLQFDSWVILGHSFGGMLAYAYAAKYPETISAMIQSSSGGCDLSLLANTNFTRHLSEKVRDSFSYYNQKVSNGDLSYNTRYKRAYFMSHAYLYDTSKIETVAKRLLEVNSEINSLVWQNMRAINFDVSDEMKNFQKPVLIIHGKNDLVSMSIPTKAHEILPHAELVFLDQCKHYGWIDRKEAYYSAIHTFLNKLD